MTFQAAFSVKMRCHYDISVKMRCHYDISVKMRCHYDIFMQIQTCQFGCDCVITCERRHHVDVLARVDTSLIVHSLWRPLHCGKCTLH